MTSQQPQQPKKTVYEGIRVLDLGNRYVGTTLASSLMAEFGADVIKIDEPNLEPPPMGGAYVKDGVYLPYKVQGRNKRHITLDITKPKGRDLFLQLVAKVDVVIETYPAGTMENWNLGWDDLSAVNSRLIFCRISDFGQTGPYKDRRLDGRTSEAFGGFSYIDGEADGSPLHSQMDMGGETAGVWAATGIGMALYWRDLRGGTGQVLDIGLYEPLYRQIQTNVTPYASTGVADKRFGNRRATGLPWVDSHETKDGKFFSYSGATRGSYRDTNLSMGMHVQERFKDLPTTYRHRQEFHDEAAKWMKERTLAEVDDKFARFDGASAPCNTAEDLINDRHTLYRELVITVPDEELGPVRMQGVVPKMSRTPGTVTSTGERPGARNAEVYGELLGLDAAALQALQSEGLI
jgi:crotonobetainyl-CoA:carnitine CoA-transferase CaiB-like acyl-CoA transferase